MIFQSTHPGWGATIKRRMQKWERHSFQSTHPGWGATIRRLAATGCMGYFNPRTPGGVRPCILSVFSAGRQISIHAPRVGCDMTLSTKR